MMRLVLGNLAIQNAQRIGHGPALAIAAHLGRDVFQLVSQQLHVMPAGNPGSPPN